MCVRKMPEAFISRKAFLVGLIIVILASSGVSAVISTQWAQGPQGPKGDKGDTGDVGPQGVQGETGAQGEQGLAGADGAQGPQGLQGLKGDTGATGATGPQGPIGPEGPPGVVTIENASGWVTPPAYDSGWMQLSGSNSALRFVHGLGTTHVFIDLRRNTTIPGSEAGINDGVVNDELRWYNLTDNDVLVYDGYGGGAHEIRVMVWKIYQP